MIGNGVGWDVYTLTNITLMLYNNVPPTSGLKQLSFQICILVGEAILQTVVTRVAVFHT